MHIGGPAAPTSSGRAIHWHADPATQVEYIFTDAERQTIPYVKVTDAENRVREYMVEGTKPEELAKGQHRSMDCVDCHNVTAHRIAPTVEQAVDRAIASGSVSADLPFVRREAVRLLSASHATADEGAGGHRPRAAQPSTRRTDAAAIRRSRAAVTALQSVYRRNVFPDMKVTFGTYPDNLGHMSSSGCFRCHDESHVAKDGSDDQRRLRVPATSRSRHRDP